MQSGEIRGGTTREVSYSEKVSGKGSIKKDYYIMNKANDSAKVSVDIKNATYYEYRYGIHSDEVQCIAGLDLVVGHAESIKCSGDAKNRNNVPTDMIALIENGNLTYNNSVVASNQGVQASQNIVEALGDIINAAGTARDDDNNIIVSNSIAANRSESFQSAQMVSIGSNTSTHAQVDATTGPLNVSSYIGAGDRKLNATLDAAAGIVSIDQLINPFEARQNSQGVIGGANFDILIENANGDKTHVYTSMGSGNLTSLSQHTSGQDTGYAMEYEYLPVSYSTGIYDIGYMEGGSDFDSNKSLASKVISENCEGMDIIHKANFNENPWINTSLDATTGPLNVSSYIGAGDRKLNAIADVATGVLSIDQLINLTEANQNSAGVIGGASFDTVITDTDGKKNRAYTSVGSGSLDLSQRASLKDARYKVEYEYMPVSYQTGTYDTNLNSSKIERLPPAIGEVSTFQPGPVIRVPEKKIAQNLTYVNESKSQTIGSDGGSINLSGGIRVVIPSGAVDQELEVSVRKLDPATYLRNNLYDGIVLEIQAPAEKLNRPAEIRVPLPSYINPDNGSAFGGFVDETGALIVENSTIETMDGRSELVVSTGHFSIYEFFWPDDKWPPLPPQAGPLLVPFYEQGTLWSPEIISHPLRTRFV